MATMTMIESADGKISWECSECGALLKDFTEPSIAYTAAIEAGKSKGVQFTSDECGYVENALEECERLKEAVRWERECRCVWSWLNNTLGNVRADLEIQRSTLAASKAVENLL